MISGSFLCSHTGGLHNHKRHGTMLEVRLSKGVKMKHILYPDEYLPSAYQIDFDKLYQEGYRGAIFDIDNTLVPHGAPADQRAIALFAHLKELGFQCVLLSNNKEPRVVMFNEKIQVKYIFKAGKPKPVNYRKAMELMHTDGTDTVFVGDQIFTDVAGANLAGIRTILVAPINPKEEIQIVLKRYLERVVLAFYKRRKKSGAYTSCKKKN